MSYEEIVPIASDFEEFVRAMGTAQYAVWKKAEKEMTKYSLAESDGITELCSGPGYMRNKYPIASFEDNLSCHLKRQRCPFQLATMPILALLWGLYDATTSRQASTAS